MKSYVLFIFLLLIPTFAIAADFMHLFKNSTPIIAAVMVDPLGKSSYKKTEAWLIEQASIASTGGMDGLLVEFRGGGILSRDIPDWELQMMADLTKKISTKFPQLVIGVEILWHFPGATLKLAKMSEASFVRVDFFSDAVIADKLVVPIDPAGLIQYRKKLNADNIALLTDIQVKYSTMLDPQISISSSAERAQKMGSNGVIISGSKSGTSPETQKLTRARQGARSIPVVIGSGFSLENAKDILPLVDAVIVGTSISKKTGGPLLPEKVSALMTYVNEFRNNKSNAKDL